MPDGSTLYVRGISSAHSYEADGNRHLVVWYFIPGKDNCGRATNEWLEFTSLEWSGCKTDKNLTGGP